MRRKQQDIIVKDLTRKMVFITGPRQVGKTSLALAISEGFEKSLYLNYDNLEHRSIIHKAEWLPDTKLLILNELHKMENWKNYLKGIYDTKPPSQQILVTGSARLEAFRQSGDSLAGRFFRHRLGPFSMAEILDSTGSDLDLLLERGGFPEPFLVKSGDDANRWRLQYIDGLIRTDILDFEKIHDFRAIQLTLELLRHRVGSPVSWSSVARDVKCAPNTIKKYVTILESLFIVFRVTPFHRNIGRSLLKEPKIYFYDTGMVLGDEGARLENLVAVSLLKHLNWIEDSKGISCSLRTLRTKEKKEIDFVMVENEEAKLIVEVKLSDSSIAPSLHYFNKKYDMDAVQVVKNLRVERMVDGVQLRQAEKFLKDLSL
ncbi:MAG TPA: ATP-binding protein [Desulfobacterales bacterium]|nr:ATP-binding protein [Desulfobacterales bacterium]HIP38057.1 ATP-binding protein [Desulfocapsa sulfexigens]